MEDQTIKHIVNLYHQIRMQGGKIILVPTSIPEKLLKYIDTSHIIDKEKLEEFKQKVRDLFHG